jgi:hypothetical protein
VTVQGVGGGWSVCDSMRERYCRSRGSAELPAYLPVQWPNLATRTDDNDALLDATARSIVSMAAGKSPTPSLTKTEFSSEIVRYVRACSTRAHATSSSGGPFNVLPLAVVPAGGLTVGGGRKGPRPGDVRKPIVLDMAMRDRQGST